MSFAISLLGCSVPLGKDLWGHPRKQHDLSTLAPLVTLYPLLAMSSYFFFLHPWPYFTWLNIYSFQTVFWVIVPSDVLLSLPDAGSSILSLLTFLHLWVYVV